MISKSKSQARKASEIVGGNNKRKSIEKGDSLLNKRH